MEEWYRRLGICVDDVELNLGICVDDVELNLGSSPERVGNGNRQRRDGRVFLDEAKIVLQRPCIRSLSLVGSVSLDDNRFRELGWWIIFSVIVVTIII